MSNNLSPRALLLKRLKEAAARSISDPEAGHGLADDAVVDYFKRTAPDIAQALEAVRRWYA